MTRKFVFSLALALLLGTLAPGAFADAVNEPPPSGSILDLNNQTIDHGAAVTESVDFTAAVANTDITFAFREDPAYISFSNVSLVDVTSGSATNLILNGDFSSGSSNTATDWTYDNVYGATFGGVVATTSCNGGFSSCWYDGAVQAYDAIDQLVGTNINDTYTLSFQYSDSSGYPTFSDISTNGDTTDSGGNGVDILAYAQAGLPPAAVTPEPSTFVMLGTGLLALAGVVRGRRRQSTI